MCVYCTCLGRAQTNYLRVVGRGVSFAEMHGSETPEEGGAERYPVSPRPVAFQPERAAQPGQLGNMGSPGRLHLPKEPMLRPRDSKAQGAELATSTDHSEPSVASPAMPSGVIYVSENPASSTSSEGASSVGRSGEMSTSSRPVMQEDERYENPSSGSFVERAMPEARDRTEFGKLEPVQDTPTTPRSPTALQAKLQRLRAKWSALAERGHPPLDSQDASKAARPSEKVSVVDSIAVSATVPQRFTIVELDRESAGVDRLPQSTSASTVPDQMAAAGDSTDATYSQVKAESADVSLRRRAEGKPVRSAWEETLGLPAGVNLWGPTVVELPDPDTTTSPSENMEPDRTSKDKQEGSHRVYVTAPRPVAEAIETESFDESSQLTSPTTASISITDMQSPASHTDTSRTLNIMGNSAFEKYSSTPTSPKEAPSTLTLESPSASVAERPRHLTTRVGVEEPTEAPALTPSQSAVQATKDTRLTLDQKLSTDKACLHIDPTRDCHPQAEQKQCTGSSLRASDVKYTGADAEHKLVGAQPAAAAADMKSHNQGAARNAQIGPSSTEQEGKEWQPSGDEPAGMACAFGEPAALDRGEPSLEDTLRSQEAASAGRRGAQLPRKRASLRQRAPSSGTPQRQFSPFGRLTGMQRAQPDQANDLVMPVPSGMQTDNSRDEPKQASEAARGPGPLEKGMHEVELGGYYLSTPDPLRTNPEFALRRRTSSELSMQSAAQHGQHASDPLNFDPVHYVSSPAWRMNTMTAFDRLHPSTEEPATASGSLALHGASRLATSSASTRLRRAQEAPCLYLENSREHRPGTENGSQHDEHIRNGGEGTLGREDGKLRHMPPGAAMLPGGTHEHGSRSHVKGRKSRTAGGKRYVQASAIDRHRVEEPSPSMSQVSPHHLAAVPAFLRIAF